MVVLQDGDLAMAMGTAWIASAAH